MIRKLYLYVVIIAWLIGSVLAGCKSPAAAAQQVNALDGQSGEFRSAPTQITPTAASAAATESVETQMPTGQPQTAAPTAVQGGQPAQGAAITRTPIPAPPVATTAAPDTDAPSAPASGASSPQIISFTASPAEVRAGETVTVSWSAIGARANLGVTFSDGLTEYQYVPLSGTRTITVPTNVRYAVSFSLVVSGDNGASVLGNVGSKILCTDTWFFSGGPYPDGLCPLPQEASDATMQPFEHGFMMWVKSDDRVFAFIDGSTYINQADEWEPSMPDSDPSITPPPGFYQPVHGFGLAWRSWTGFVGDAILPLKDILGWATAPEIPFQVVYQCSAYMHPRSGNPPVCFYRDANGRVVGAYFGGIWKVIGQ